MIVLSWNVNGLKAFIRKASVAVKNMLGKADVLFLQETKITAENFENEKLFFASLGFEWLFLNASDQKGTAGVLMASKHQPLHVSFPLQKNFPGRVVSAIVNQKKIINIYVPHIGMELEKTPRREKWHAEFRALLHKQPPETMVFGDFNVAPENIDVYHPEKKQGKPGFTDLEKNFFYELKSEGWVDVFRTKYPKKQVYTYFDFRTNAYARKAGWRIDLVITKEPKQISSIRVIDTGKISDHLPLIVQIKKK